MFLFLRCIFRGLLVIGLWLVALQATAQTSNPYIPNVVPASPDAAVLMKFGDVPVSPYTGTADVNVPIYTIQIKGLSLPIALDYHTGGVKVKEEATWVGLGWNLSPGGMISRTINDHDDFGTASLPYFTTQVPQPDADMAASQPYPANNTPNLGPYMYDFFCTYQVGTSNGNYDYSNAFNQGVAIYDMEPDLFNYNIPGHSGKFILTRAGNVVLQKQENIRIQFPSNGSSFTITDDQGNKYYFGVHDQTPSAGGEQSATVWYMTKIVTQQNDSIVFNYTVGGYNIKAPLNQYFNSYCSPSGTVTTQGAPTTYTCQTLNSIDFPTGHLSFQWDSKRSDMNGGTKLDSVLIYAKNGKGALSYQKQFNFNYSYFNATTPAPPDSFELYRLRLDSVQEKTITSSLPPYSFAYNNITSSFKCIKDSFDVDHWGYFNAGNNSSLIPTINVGYAPPGNTGVESFFTYTGANREPNATYMVAFSLQQVKYPTGGKTIFNYQPNDYDYQNSQTGPQDFQYQKLVTVDSIVNVVKHGTTSGTINLNYIQPIVPAGSGQINLNIFVTFRFQGDTSYNYKNTLNKLTFDFSGGGGNVSLHQDINFASCSGPVCTLTIPVTIAPIGTYNWSAYIDASVDTVTQFSETELHFQYKETQQDYNLLNNGSFISPASGLRIQSVLNYSDSVTIASEKVYTYGYSADKLGTGTPQSYSYGRLMSFPSYVRYAIVPASGGAHCDQLSLFSSSYTALSSVIQGNIVGYDQVTETSIDPSTGNDIGRTVYKYFNSPDSSVTYGGFRFPGCFGLGNSLTGTLLSKVTYADNSGVYNKVAETDNYYHTTNRNVYFSPKYSFAQTSTPAGSYCSAGTAINYEVMACFYPSIKSERTLLDSSTEISYQQLDTTKAVAKTTAFYYDNPIHYQVTRSRTIDSKGNKLVDRSRYPQDYIPNGNTVTGNTILDSMIGRNMISETIEKADSIYYPGASSGSVTGAQLNLYRRLPVQGNTIGADRIYKLDLKAPVTNFQPFAISGNTTSMDSRYEQKISFDHYDSYSNPVQYTPEDGVIVSFLWDYTGHYPIAKVTSADSADIAYTSFEADGTGNWTWGSGTVDSTTAVTGRRSYNLTGSVTKSGLTSSNTYIVSYWTLANAGAFSIAGTMSGYPMKGKTVTVNNSSWTLYVHKVTGQTTISVSGSGHIDELRLYPSTGQMATYTYDPLVGVTSQIDPGNRATYYQYDGFQRLIRIRDQDYNILKTLEYQYKTPAGCGSGCYMVAMQTFAGSNTLSYPVGVFNVNGKLLGNVTNSATYITKWNSDTADNRLGTLAAGKDSMHFNVALHAGQTLPAGVIGCRYYQWDLPWTNIDAIGGRSGAYVDFGDGTGVRIPKSPTDTVGFGAHNTFVSGYYIVHTYPDSSLKTVTIYHNDANEDVGLDNAYDPAASLTRVRHLRGYFPQHTVGGKFSSMQQSSALTMDSIWNWNSITSVTTFSLATGDGGTNACKNLHYAQDFMKNNQGLQSLISSYGQYFTSGVLDTTFKITKLKSNWNTYFTNLQVLQISDDHWNREDVSALTHLQTFIVAAGNHDGYGSFAPIPYQTVDNIINQIATGAGSNVSNGLLGIGSYGGGRSAASNASVTFLLSKGWKIILDGVYITQ